MKGRHEYDIIALRMAGAQPASGDNDWTITLERLAYDAAASLIGCHDDTGLDLHTWPECLALVEHLLGHELDEEIT